MKRVKITKASIRDLLSGNFLTKDWMRNQYKYLLMLALMMIVYISHGFVCEGQKAKIIKMDKAIKDARYERLSVSAKLVELSRQSSVEEKLKELDSPLSQSSEAPIKVD